MGVLDGTKANSAPNLVGVGAGAELGKSCGIFNIVLKHIAMNIFYQYRA